MDLELLLLHFRFWGAMAWNFPTIFDANKQPATTSCRQRSKKKHFHDEYEISKLGDVVLIAPYRSGTVPKGWGVSRFRQFWPFETKKTTEKLNWGILRKIEKYGGTVVENREAFHRLSTNIGKLDLAGSEATWSGTDWLRWCAKMMWGPQRDLVFE